MRRRLTVALSPPRRLARPGPMVLLVGALVIAALSLSIPSAAGQLSSIWTRSTSKIGSPSSTVYFDIQLQESRTPKADFETYFLGATNLSQGWLARFFYGSDEITSITLRRNEAVTIKMEIWIPSTTPPGNYGFTFTATEQASGNITSVALAIRIQQPDREISLASAYPYASVATGQTISYPLIIRNVGVTDELLALNWTIPSGWGIRFLTADMREVLGVFLAAGQSAALTVEVTPPDEVAPGQYLIAVGVTSQDRALNTVLPLNANLYQKEVKMKVGISSTFPEVSIEAGKAFQYPITITNSGNNDTSLMLSILSAPKDWNVAFKSGTVGVSRIYLTPGQSVNLVVEATPPSLINLSSYKILIGARSEDGLVSSQLELKARIVGSYSLGLELSTLLTTITGGGTTTLTAKVTNTGQSPVTTLAMSIDAPDGWETSFTPAQTASLGPRESFTFNLAVAVPSDAVAGDYMLTLKASSDQVQSDAAQVRVTVQAPTSWGFMGVGIALVAVAALVIVFMKFRRR